MFSFRKLTNLVSWDLKESKFLKYMFQHIKVLLVSGDEHKVSIQTFILQCGLCKESCQFKITVDENFKKDDENDDMEKEKRVILISQFHLWLCTCLFWGIIILELQIEIFMENLRACKRFWIAKNCIKKLNVFSTEEDSMAELYKHINHDIMLGETDSYLCVRRSFFISKSFYYLDNLHYLMYWRTCWYLQG